MNTRSACDWLSVTPECATDPMLSFEVQAARAGSRVIAGVDEAGRGALAGPLVAAAMTLCEPVPGVDDSKKLTPARRDALYDTLMSEGHIVGVESIDADVIDKNGIQSVNYLAMARALDHQDPQADFALVDGFTIRGCLMPQLRIVKGDQRSQSIAAASIIAKVTRDRIMVSLDEVYPEYGFARHKGYGTREHMDAIEKNGPSPVHRMSFAPMAVSQESLHLFGERDIPA